MENVGTSVQLIAAQHSNVSEAIYSESASAVTAGIFFILFVIVVWILVSIIKHFFISDE